jgi:hypothetical protein
MRSPCCLCAPKTHESLNRGARRDVVNRQRLDEHISTATNIHTIEEPVILFYMWSVWYTILNTA